MAEFFLEYGLFVAKVITLVIAVALVIAMVVASTRRERAPEKLNVKHLNKKYHDMTHVLRKETLPKKLYKRAAKAEKAHKKELRKKTDASQASPRRLFIVNFHGDLKATALSSLREELTAVLSVATPNDEVVVRLENAGGLVHEHGLGASQLLRVRKQNIPLTVTVDKVAASGGYMMACVADRIIAAPFAIVGSIGVLAQIPNFNRLLDNHGVDFEQFKAGDFKRTVTVFGKNTDEGRAKFKEELEDVHLLFKDFVANHRPAIDIQKVATGEHWYGTRALELSLVDQLMTSDEYLLAESERAELYEVTFTARKTLAERMFSMTQQALARFSQWGWHYLDQRRLP